MTTYLITGGCGFIGSNFIRYLMASDRSSRIVNLDKLTYAGNPENLKDLEDNSRYHFVHGDICDSALIEGVFNDFSPDVVINFAAESHVDRSIGKPDDFIRTDVFGVLSCSERQKTTVSICSCRSVPMKSTVASRTVVSGKQTL